ncbi:MAG: HEAT repeat domain-containing protein, partial [Candidatus Brocadiaceae bacterium]
MGEGIQAHRGAVVRRLLLLPAVVLFVVCGSCKAPPAEVPAIPEEPPLSAVERQRYAQAESLLRSADPEARERAAVALLSMDHPDALATVLDVMGGAEDPAVRASMIQAAAFCTDHRCFEAVLGAMADPDASVQRAAADALARFTRPQEVRAVAEYVTAPETPERQRTLLYQALGRGLAVPAVPVLLDALENEEGEARLAAWEALKRISRRDLPAEAGAWREWWAANSHRTRTDVLEEHLRAASGEVEAMSGQLRDLE